MPRIKILFAVSTLLITSLACVTILGEETPEEQFLPGFEETQPAVEALSCPDITDQIVEVNLYVASSGTNEEETMDFSARDENNQTYIASYLVAGDEIGEPVLENVPTDLQDEQDDTATHERIWEYYTALIPLENRDRLAEFWVMTDGQDNILAGVAQTYDDPTLWALEVDIADVQDYYYLTFTLVHEFAHLLTLGPGQVPPSEAIFNNPEDNDIYLQEISACSNFFSGEGCANSDSYINEFHDTFWVEIHDEWNEINLVEDNDIYHERLDEFYDTHQDQFLTDYSVTHPAEDIAESFAFFVFSPQPDGDTIAEQKILFFYGYPELVELRTNIINNVCQAFPE